MLILESCISNIRLQRSRYFTILFEIDGHFLIYFARRVVIVRSTSAHSHIVLKDNLNVWKPSRHKRSWKREHWSVVACVKLTSFLYTIPLTSSVSEEAVVSKDSAGGFYWAKRPAARLCNLSLVLWPRWAPLEGLLIWTLQPESSLRGPVGFRVPRSYVIHHGGFRRPCMQSRSPRRDRAGWLDVMFSISPICTCKYSVCVNTYPCPGLLYGIRPQEVNRIKRFFKNRWHSLEIR